MSNRFDFADLAMQTELCHHQGIAYPIMAPMGPDITGPDLVAAVSNAGGLGPALHSQNTTTAMTNHDDEHICPVLGHPAHQPARHSHHGRDNPWVWHEVTMSL